MNVWPRLPVTENVCHQAIIGALVEAEEFSPRRLDKILTSVGDDSNEILLHRTVDSTVYMYMYVDLLTPSPPPLPPSLSACLHHSFF